MNTTANLLQPLTIADAPAASKPIMEGIQKGFGFIPNLMAVALKTISNYLDHINPAPLDAAFTSEK